jgi:hypothetical protein
MGNSPTRTRLPSMLIRHQEGVHRAMCMLRRENGLLRSKSPGRLRAIDSFLVFCYSRRLYLFSRDRAEFAIEISAHKGRGSGMTATTRVIRNVAYIWTEM